MNTSTKKWLLLKYSSAVFIPLMLWFIINFVAIYNSDYIEIIEFFTKKSSMILFTLFIIFAYLFSSLTISEVLEDYIDDEKIKNVANKLLYIFAIIFPLITIFSILRITI